nr:MAG TPA_asm: hypothetical protein [Caudoviricetes sp.]
MLKFDRRLILTGGILTFANIRSIIKYRYLGREQSTEYFLHSSHSMNWEAISKWSIKRKSWKC